jgi:hypothetical protein
MSSSIQTKRPRRSFGSEPLPMTRKEAGELKAVGKAAQEFLERRQGKRRFNGRPR